MSENNQIVDEIEADARRSAYSHLQATIHPRYATSFIDKGGKTLVVVFSPNAKLMLQKYGFDHDVLYLADKKLHYYTYNPGRQSKVLSSFIENCGYDKVVYLGSSKGGTGALLWSSLTHRLNRKFTVFAIAFSPQIQLYPYNTNLESLPSYLNNFQLVRTNEVHRKNFETYGNLREIMGRSSSPALLVYGGRSPMDATEAAQMVTIPNVVLRPINVSFHGSIIPFVTDLSSHAAVASLADKLTRDASSDNDLSATILQTKEEFVSELMTIRCPSLNQLIEQSVDRFTGGRFV